MDKYNVAGAGKKSISVWRVYRDYNEVNRVYRGHNVVERLTQVCRGNWDAGMLLKC